MIIVKTDEQIYNSVFVIFKTYGMFWRITQQECNKWRYEHFRYGDLPCYRNTNKI